MICFDMAKQTSFDIRLFTAENLTAEPLCPSHICPAKNLVSSLSEEGFASWLADETGRYSFPLKFSNTT